MAKISGITFLGYLDGPEEMLSGKRRCLYLCDGESNTEDLPTTAGLETDSGVSSVPAPGSIALVRGGDTLALGTDGSWAAL